MQAEALQISQLPSDVIKATTTAKFRTDVIIESITLPVLVDFWAQ